jgi:2-iminoacetate synthase
MGEWFDLDACQLGRVRARAAGVAARASVRELLGGVENGAPASNEEVAALFLSPHVTTEELLALARVRRGGAAPRLETFSPLYITNECDAECRMCGMRGTNAELVRETAPEATVVDQLELLQRRGMLGVAILTGEYRHGARRRTMIARAARAIEAALARGFRHVLINIGSLEMDEYDELLAAVPRRADGQVLPHITMCTFQETYSPEAYARFMGTDPENPRSDFNRRLTNFDRARDAGMRSANPGVLLGLNPDLGYELLALLAHVDHLARRGMTVYVSLPRLRKASGTPHLAGVSDDALGRFVSVLSFGCPGAKVVISTREPPAIQRRLVPVIGVLTPGSPGVAPYTADGARFELEASQFEVLDHRPFEAILDEFISGGAAFECFEKHSASPSA